MGLRSVNGDSDPSEAMLPEPESNGRDMARHEHDGEALRRIEAKADTAIGDIRACTSETRGHKRILENLVLASADQGTKLDNIAKAIEGLRLEVYSRVAAVEGAQRAGAMAADRQIETVRQQLNKHASTINRAAPLEPDIAEITKTGIPSVSAVVASELLKRENESRGATLAEIKEGRRFWTRQIVTWFVAGFGALALMAISVLLTLLLKR